MYGWATEHPQYIPPQIGIPQSEANALAAVEVSRRADADAQHYAEKAQAAEMIATRLAQEAKEATRKEKEDKAAALEAAEAKEVEAALWAQIRFDQANAAATHRKVLADIAAAAANRSPVTHGLAPEPFPPPGANAIPADTNQALAPPLSATPASNFAAPTGAITVPADPQQALAPPLASFAAAPIGNLADPLHTANAANQPTCIAPLVPNRFGTLTCVNAFIRAISPARRS